MAENRRLIHIISSNTWGGMERYALDICRYFGSRGWSVTAYTRDAKVVDNEFARHNIDLRHAPLGGFFDPASATLLASDLRHEPHATVVHVHRYCDAFTVLLACKLSRRKDIRIIYTHHNVRRGRRGWLAGKIYRNIDTHIFVSAIARRTFFSAWDNDSGQPGILNSRVVHDSIFFSQPLRQDEPKSGPIVAMFHGRLSPEKGVETLVDALPRLKGKRTRLWITGTGDPDYVDTLKRRALSLGVLDLIDWKGHVKDVHKLIPLCHFGVLPSRWEEGFGLSNIEYMANGRPQICTDNGAQPEYLTNESEALMIPPGDTDALGDALVRLAEDEQLRTRLGENSHRRFAAELSWEHFAEKLGEIYANVATR